MTVPISSLLAASALGCSASSPSGHVAVQLLGDVVKHLVTAVADLALHLGALIVGHLLGLGLGDQGPPELVLAVSDEDLLAQLTVKCRAFLQSQLGHEGEARVKKFCNPLREFALTLLYDNEAFKCFLHMSQTCHCF